MNFDDSFLAIDPRSVCSTTGMGAGGSAFAVSSPFFSFFDCLTGNSGVVRGGVFVGGVLEIGCALGAGLGFSRSNKNLQKNLLKKSFLKCKLYYLS